MQVTQAQGVQVTVPMNGQNQQFIAGGTGRVEGYHSKAVWGLSMTQIVLGSLAIILQVWDLANMSALAPIASGIWCGMMFIVTGTIGMVSSKQKTYCWIAAFLVLTICSIVFGIVLLFINAVSLANYTDYWYIWDESDYMINCTIFLTSLMIIIAVIDAIIAIVSSCLACYSCCHCCPSSGNSQQGLMYFPQAQNDATSNGQMFVVTNNQLGNMVPRQQYIVAPNPGTFVVPTYNTTMPGPQLLPVQQNTPPPMYEQVMGAQAAANINDHAAVHQPQPSEPNEKVASA